MAQEIRETMSPTRRLLGATTLMSDDVYNQNDEKLGDVKEFMLDVPSGTVCYAVLSFGGFLGMGEKLFAVPWGALTLDREKKRFVLNGSVERFKEAPGFDKDHWPDMADPSWEKIVHSYYGTQSDAAKASVPPI